MRRQDRNFPVLLLNEPLSDVENPALDGGCYLYLTPFWGAIIGRFLEALDTDDIWTVALQQQAREYVRQLMDMLTCELPEREIIKRLQGALLIAENNDECEECEDEEMSCIKRVRIHSGKLQVSYFDEHSCADCWEDVGDYVLDDIGVNVGDILLDSENRAREGRKIRIRPPVVNINEEELARCAKATAIVDTALAAFDAIVGVKNGWVDIISEIIPISTLWEIAKEFIPDAITDLFKVAEFIAVALGVNDEELEALTLFSTNVVREEVICQYIKVIKNSEEVIGEDLTNLAVVLAKLDFQAVEVFYRIIRTWDIFVFRDVVSRQEENVDCGCGRVTNPETRPEPEDYDWCYVFSFKQDDYVEHWAVTTENGTAGAIWTNQVGYEEKNAAFMRTLSIHKNNFTSTLTGIDAKVKNVRTGHYEENDDPNRVAPTLQITMYAYDINGHVYGFFSEYPSQAAEKTIQWRGIANLNDKSIAFRAIVSYDGQGYQNIPDNDAGNLILESIKMWGKGTNPFGVDNCN